MKARPQIEANAEKIKKLIALEKRGGFRETELLAMLEREKDDLKLATTKTIKEAFIDYVVDAKLLEKRVLLDNDNETHLLYVVPNANDYAQISGIKANSYFTHYTALHLHQLTLQIPKVVYLNHEKAMPLEEVGGKDVKMSQSSIDAAFGKAQRFPKHYYTYEGKRMYVLNGKHTGRLGVIDREMDGKVVSLTDLERTLIDVTVRPDYAGGITEVLGAYRNAKGRLDAERMADYLKRLGYVYPYHQAIGFYMEKAGYGEDGVRLFKGEMENDFYISYNIKQKAYSEVWRLYYPKGF
jgi:hypothetical protein